MEEERKIIYLKDLKNILISDIIFQTMTEDGEEKILYTSYDFEFDEEFPAELWEMEVDNIYSYYDKDMEKDFTVVWLCE